MDKIECVLVEAFDKAKYENEIVDYYSRYFPEESNILIAKNSSVFWLAKKNEEIIGVTRILTDYSRYALLLDLIVRKTERNKGIGKTLVKLVKKYCREKGIKKLILTTDPKTNWLTDFYQKLGFKIIKDQTLMEFKP